MIFCTSDLHLGHDKIRDYMPERGARWGTVTAMDIALIEAWNAAVGPDDEVYVLGDFALYGKCARPVVEATLALMRGRKTLVVGNHDHRETRRAAGWAAVEYEIALDLPEGVFVLSHYPRDEWWGREEGVVLLHGHTHGGGHRGDYARLPNRIDVGVDCWDFAPVSIARIAEEIALRRNAMRE